MQRIRLWSLGSLSAVTGLAFAGATALGQYSSDFESLTASASGEILTGQDGYYLPPGTTSVDFLAYTYAGNALGLPANPVGGDQFVAGVGPGSPTFGRAQRDITWGSGVWRVSYDATCFYQGQPPSSNNVGSFSVQPYPGSQNYIHLFSWVDVNAATEWQAFYLAYDAGGVAHTQPGQSPGPEWTNLPLEEWYRFETIIDFDANQIIEVSIEGLTTPVSATFAPPDWYLEGGSGGGSPMPTGFRFFAGGGVAGNGTAWDNMVAEPVGGGFTLELSGDCPGPMTATTSNGTPNVRHAFIRAMGEGSVVIPPGNPCEGTMLGLNATAVLAGTAVADGSGSASLGANAPATACNRVFLQALDTDTCDTSNVVVVQ